METKKDCRHFVGYMPCKHHKEDGSVCEDCKHYKKNGKKILLINFVGLGDVLRTTAMIRPLKKKYPDCHITFLTGKQGYDIIKNIPEIEKPLLMSLETALRLMVEKFDIMINYDKQDDALAIAALVKAKHKHGIYMDESGHLAAFDKKDEILVDIGLSDEIKGSNKKTMQQIMFEVAELEYNGDMPLYNISEESRQYAKEMFKKNGISPKDIVIGLNTGVGGRIFPNRKWPAEYFIRLSEMIEKDLKAKVAILGGPEEKELNKRIIRGTKAKVIDAGTENTIEQYSALVERCDVIVTVDTLALHLAAALSIPVVALFGPTNKHELEIYGKGKKLAIDELKCIFCYKHRCRVCESDVAKCMEMITPEMVLDAIRETLKEHGRK